MRVFAIVKVVGKGLDFVQASLQNEQICIHEIKPYRAVVLAARDLQDRRGDLQEPRSPVVFLWPCPPAGEIAHAAFDLADAGFEHRVEQFFYPPRELHCICPLASKLIVIIASPRPTPVKVSQARERVVRVGKGMIGLFCARSPRASRRGRRNKRQRISKTESELARGRPCRAGTEMLLRSKLPIIEFPLCGEATGKFTQPAHAPEPQIRSRPVLTTLPRTRER